MKPFCTVLYRFILFLLQKAVQACEIELKGASKSTPDKLELKPTLGVEDHFTMAPVKASLSRVWPVISLERSWTLDSSATVGLSWRRECQKVIGEVDLTNESNLVLNENFHPHEKFLSSFRQAFTEGATPFHVQRFLSPVKTVYSVMFVLEDP